MKKCIIILFLFIPAFIYGQKFTASAEKEEVAVGDLFEVEFALNATGTNFTPPSFKGLQVLEGPNAISVFQSINGRNLRKIGFTYILVAEKPGKFVIEPAKIRSGGKVLLSNPLTINVIASKQKQTDQSRRSIGNDNAEVFLIASINKTQSVLGEAVAVTYKLYTRYADVDAYDVVEMPDYNGFWMEEKKVDGVITLEEERYNGKNYRTGVLKKVILFPQRTGNLEIAPLKVQVRGSTRETNIPDDFSRYFPFEDFFGSTTHWQKEISSGLVSVKVSPLPAEGKPDNFSGFVGHASIETQADQSMAKKGEPLNINVTLYGEGNLTLVEPFELGVAHTEVFQPVVESKTTVTSSNLRGSKTFSYTVIPKDTGLLTVPAIEFGYYSSDEEAYKIVRSQPLELPIEQGEELPEFVEKSDPEIKDDEEMPGIMQILIWTAIAGVPLMLALAFLAIRKSKAKKNVSKPVQRVAPQPEARLHKAEEVLWENDDKFFSGLLDSLYEAVLFAGDLRKGELSHENIEKALKTKGVPEDMVVRLLEVIDKCEYARYAPAGENVSKEALLIDVRTMLGELRAYYPQG